MQIKVGDRFETNNYGSCVVIEYIDCNNVRIRFEDGAEKICTAQNLRNGNVKYPSLKFSGVGFIGIGIYSYTSHKRIYMVWICMLQRCYNEDIQRKYPTYIGCTVDIRWHSFQNFAHDYLLMVGSDLDWHLDKDILFKRNKIYSRETCCLVPSKINYLLTKSDASRGELRIGVTYREGRTKPYQARCNIEGKTKHLGSFKTEQEAYLVYKPAKEAEIKRLANLYKEELDPRVYQALVDYKVDFDD
jgi:hypothetical protein